ncbi:hypothetical protein BHE74_00021377 [Ensete ventricosum]|nr:hypothetical protein GW17_00007813 [Ensete ventricosum]RWW70916.1 hypothetical protein BHE74_00021377 [Ensete ventricosum]RZR82012.1 hypothetical protein BHM03_00008348 [Ensete ventricosum]
MECATINYKEGEPDVRIGMPGTAIRTVASKDRPNVTPGPKKQLRPTPRLREEKNSTLALKQGVVENTQLKFL